MEEMTLREDENFIHITGTIQNLPEVCGYIFGETTRAKVAFDILSARPQRKDEQEPEYDLNRIIIFDDEDFITKFKNGDRITVKGELQSRNFTRDKHNHVDENLQLSVSNYIDIFEEYPTSKKPRGKSRELIQWDKLLSKGLLPSIPEDSMFKENGEKVKEKDMFMYRVDEGGTVYKESQHVAYEVIAKSVVLENEPLDLARGDRNKITLAGKVTKNPYFNYLGKETTVSFCSFNISTRSKLNPERVYYINVISWSKLADEIFSEIQQGDMVYVTGRLQSRSFQKELVKRWKTPSGNKKKKNITLELLTREVSATKIKKCIKEDK